MLKYSKLSKIKQLKQEHVLEKLILFFYILERLICVFHFESDAQALSWILVSKTRQLLFGICFAWIHVHDWKVNSSVRTPASL